MILPLGLRGNPLGLGLCLRYRYARRKPRVRDVAGVTAHVILIDRFLERNPDIVLGVLVEYSVKREPEPSRHGANDDIGLAIQSERLSDDSLAKLGEEAMRDERYIWTVRCREESSRRRSNSSAGDERGRDFKARDVARLAG